jgi:hypothetical protein
MPPWAAGRGPAGETREWLVSLAVLASITIVISSFFLAVYPLRGYTEPLGYDTVRYIWRTNCIADGGLEALRQCREELSSRIGYPFASLFLSTLLGASRFTVAAVLPVVAVVALASCSAGLVGRGIREGKLGAAAVALVVATSPMTVLMAGFAGYTDTLLALVLGLGAMVAVLEVALQGRAYLPAIALLGMMAVVHWPVASCRKHSSPPGCPSASPLPRQARSAWREAGAETRTRRGCSPGSSPPGRH